MQPGLPGSSGLTWLGVVRVVEQQQHPLAVEQAAQQRALRFQRCPGRAVAARRARRRSHAARYRAAPARWPGRSRAGSRRADRRGSSGATCRANRIASVVLPTPAVPVIERYRGPRSRRSEQPAAGQHRVQLGAVPASRPANPAASGGTCAGRRRAVRGPTHVLMSSVALMTRRGAWCGLPAAERRQRRRTARRSRARAVERRVHREQPLVDPGQLDARVDAEVLGQPLPGVAEDAAAPRPACRTGTGRSSAARAPARAADARPPARRARAPPPRPAPGRASGRPAPRPRRCAARSAAAAPPRRTGPGTPANGWPRHSASASSSARTPPAASPARAQPARPAQAVLELLASRRQDRAAACSRRPRTPGRGRVRAATGPGRDAAGPARARGAAPPRRCRCRPRRWPAADRPTPRRPARRAETTRLARLASTPSTASCLGCPRLDLAPSAPDRDRPEHPHSQRHHRPGAPFVVHACSCPHGAVRWYSYADYPTSSRHLENI